MTTDTPAAETPKKKARYQVRNWREYEAALVRRASLTVWVDEAVRAGWCEVDKTGRRGATRTYSEMAIQCALTLRAVYRLALRTADGLLGSILHLLGESLPVPDHTTLSRRGQPLSVTIARQPAREPRHLVIDSSGLKVFGEGEWKVRQHGAGYLRVWRKLHLAVDQATHEVVAALVTTSGVGDGEVLPELLDQVKGEIGQVSADGAYDTRDCHAACASAGGGRGHPAAGQRRSVAGAGRWSYAPANRGSGRYPARRPQGLEAQQSGYHRRSPRPRWGESRVCSASVCRHVRSRARCASATCASRR